MTSMFKKAMGAGFGTAGALYGEMAIEQMREAMLTRREERLRSYNKEIRAEDQALDRANRLEDWSERNLERAQDRGERTHERTADIQREERRYQQEAARHRPQDDLNRLELTQRRGEDAARQSIANAKTPEERASAQQRYNDLFGRTDGEGYTQKVVTNEDSMGNKTSVTQVFDGPNLVAVYDQQGNPVDKAGATTAAAPGTKPGAPAAKRDVKKIAKVYSDHFGVDLSDDPAFAALVEQNDEAGAKQYAADKAKGAAPAPRPGDPGHPIQKPAAGGAINRAAEAAPPPATTAKPAPTAEKPAPAKEENSSFAEQTANESPVAEQTANQEPGYLAKIVEDTAGKAGSWIQRKGQSLAQVSLSGMLHRAEAEYAEKRAVDPGVLQTLQDRLGEMTPEDRAKAVALIKKAG